MPDPSLIHGKAIPAPELPTGTVTVRVVREAIGNNLAGQTVRVTTGSASRTDSTDEQGRAEFPNLVSGVEGRAEVTVDGETLISDPFTVPSSGGLRVILVAGLKQAAERRQKQEAAETAAPPVKGTVVFGGALARRHGVPRRSAPGLLHARDRQQRAQPRGHRRAAHHQAADRCRRRRDDGGDVAVGDA